MGGHQAVDVASRIFIAAIKRLQSAIARKTDGGAVGKCVRQIQTNTAQDILAIVVEILLAENSQFTIAEQITKLSVKEIFRFVYIEFLPCLVVQI